ncbi:hypothetical protein DID88_007800 [Monilinia fructigena]|uniref:Uncharacterized protein n=1 Tax=Monilinia fructigena TaxID=38457 RepID=A0A395J3H0_9HELO|nr:hypothetical protein DID88_007800 [Monilinia fructigena]
MRQLLRPRTPTPSQRNSQQRDEAPFAESHFTSNDRARLLQQQKIAMIQAELDLANSDMPLGASPKSQDSRKPSVTTQDFLDEAKKIMAGIRGDELEDSYQESTRELFERPPSREGAPVSRAPFIQDPELLDHLLYGYGKGGMENGRGIDKMTNETASKPFSHIFGLANTVQSEPPNIRISNNPDIQRKRKHSGSSRQMDEEYDDPDFFTQGSDNSVPTTSSRGSDSRRVIARIRTEYRVKRSRQGENDGQDSPNSEGTEDPFEDIPDLSIDETQELSRLRAVAASRKKTRNLRLAGYLDEEGQHDAFNGHSPPRNNSNLSLHPWDLNTTTPKRQRNVTITFSSPIAEVIEPPNYNDDSFTKEGAYPSDYDSVDESGTEDDDGSIRVRKGKSRQGSGPRGGYRNTSVGFRKRTTIHAAPVSRIDERDEGPLDRESVVINKTRNNPLPTPSVSPRRWIVLYLLHHGPLMKSGHLSLLRFQNLRCIKQTSLTGWT